MGTIKRNSTLAFPAEVLEKNEKTYLDGSIPKSKTACNIGEAVRALRFHPSSQGYLIVGQLNSDKLLAVSKIGNLNFTEALASKYVESHEFDGENQFTIHIPKNLYRVVDLKSLSSPRSNNAPR